MVSPESRVDMADTTNLGRFKIVLTVIIIKIL